MLTAILVAQLDSQSSINYVPRRGLSWIQNGYPLVKGSMFQYYRGDWEKGLYSTNYNAQSVSKSADGTITVTVDEPSGVRAKLTYVLKGEKLTIQYEFGWRGSETVNVENSLGYVWGPLFAPNKTVLKPNSEAWAPFPGGAPGRTYPRFKGDGQPGIVVEGPAGTLSIDSTSNEFAFNDPRVSQEIIHEKPQTLWLGQLRLPVTSDKPATGTITLQWKPSGSAQPRVEKSQLVSRSEIVRSPYPSQTIIPQPKESSLSTTSIAIPQRAVATHEKWITLLDNQLTTQYDIDNPRTGKGEIRLRVEDIKLPAEGYAINIQNDLVEVIGQDELGLRHGITTLNQIAVPSRGVLALPMGTIKDWPSIGWRGVHMFVGPSALQFQSDLMDRVLIPLRYNQVVLQAERASWDSMKGTETGLTMPKSDLEKLVTRYKDNLIEPTPLIQSMGHMEWFFANGKNLDLALNPKEPYTIDPRKAATQRKLEQLWSEVVGVFKPKVVHFGLDEVSMTGFPGDESLLTDLWKQHLPFLGQIAAKNKVEMMLWGDVLLAPGEAPDATNGVSKAVAAERRSAVPKGSIIADWHYKNEMNPGAYTSLGLLKADGFKSVASTWYQPLNIYGFAHAAKDAGSGVLQTTWAGYESSEANMLREFKQFGAYVLMGEYAWSGRTQDPRQLGYDPEKVLMEWYYGTKQPVAAEFGFAMAPTGNRGQKIKLGVWQFQQLDNLDLQSPMEEKQAKAPTIREIVFDKPVSSVCLALTQTVKMDDGEQVATVTLNLADGKTRDVPLFYGWDVRARGDRETAFRHWTNNYVSAVELGTARITGFKLTQSNPYAGLQIKGISARS
ncbi:MAG: hypothetical protein JST40_06695 [Armatimonadetes bacterium]|nr:hypothetical protein [Armatimonadota bacterium]